MVFRDTLNDNLGRGQLGEGRAKRRKSGIRLSFWFRI